MCVLNHTLCAKRLLLTDFDTCGPEGPRKGHIRFFCVCIDECMSVCVCVSVWSHLRSQNGSKVTESCLQCVQRRVLLSCPTKMSPIRLSSVRR